MPAASQTSFDVHYGLAHRRHEQLVRIVSIPARRGGKTLMSRLNDAIRSGAMRSAWGDMDEPDSTGLGLRGGNVPSASEIRERERALGEAMRRERERAKAAQDELINKAIELQRQQAAEQTQSDLEEIEGFGTF